MQTPGRMIQARSPMIPVDRRMDSSIDRMLARATEASKNIERPKVTSLGKVISELDGISGNMQEMRNQIRIDIRNKQRFYKEEAKILKQDSDNLESIASRILFSRKGLASIAGGTSAAQFAGGNIGGALSSAGIASVLMAPEIMEFISGSVVQSLALKGLIGNKQSPAAGLGTNIRGASKFKNPLLLTAALAAGLILPSLAKGQQSGDQRRQELTRKTIGGREVLNRNDVGRFRGQLGRFEKILDKINLDKRRSNRNTLQLTAGQDQSLDEALMGKPRDQTTNQWWDFLDVVRNPKERKEVGEKNQWWDFFDVFRNPLDKDDTTARQVEQEAQKEQTNLDVAVNNEVKQEEINNENLEISSNFTTENQNFFGDQISQTIESNIDLADMIAKLDIGQTEPNVKSDSTVKNNIIDLSSNNQTQSNSSGFSGTTSKPASRVHVSTKFSGSGGVLDKFDNASSLRTYGAFV